MEKPLEFIEVAIWNSEAEGKEVEFSDDAFRAAIKIFSAGLFYKTKELIEKEEMKYLSNTILTDAGTELRLFIKKFTGIDPAKLNQ